MTVPQLQQIPYSSRARRSRAASICAASRLSRSSMATSSSSPSDSTALVASSGLRRGSPVRRSVILARTGVLRAPAGLARPALCHPRADGLQEPCAPFQEEGFELLHDPMIERVCPLHSVLALSRRHSLGRRDPTSDSSG